jgi:hypothetical protein
MTDEEQAQDALSRLNETRDRLMGEIRKGIIGQDEVIEQLLDHTACPRALPAHWNSGFR